MSDREPVLLRGDPAVRAAVKPSVPPAPPSAPPTAPPSGAEGGRPRGRGSRWRRSSASNPPVAAAGPGNEVGAAARPVNTFYVAGFWQRAAAAAIDLGALMPVCLIFSWLAGALAGVHLPPSRHRGLDFWLDRFLGADPALMGAIGLSLGIGLIYAFAFQAMTHRTLGMRVLRVRVIDVYGDPPNYPRCAARSAGYLACLATIGLGFLWIGFDSEKRGLHDWLSGTYVVKDDA